MTWWAELYDDWLAEQLLELDGEVDETVAFLTQRLELAPGSRVFDQCCGIGRLSLPLAAGGVQVVGVDQAASYIERARKEAQARKLPAEFVVGDACEFTPRPRAHAALNWWTSFGYFDSDQQNLRMLARAFAALEQGGRFALDFMNVPGVLRHFRREMVTRRPTRRGEVMLLREGSVDLVRGRLNTRWSYFVNGHLQVTHDSSVRTYMPDVLVAMLKSVGFAEVELLGSTKGEPLGFDSPRLIAIARAPS